MLEEVVRDVDVRPAIVIDVRDAEAKPERDFRPEDAGLLADIGEPPAIIAVQPVPAVVVTFHARVAHAEAAGGTRRVVDDDQVKVTIAIIVQERGMCREAVVVDAVLRRLLAESRDAVGTITLVDPELVPSAVRVTNAGMAHVQVQATVAIDVRQSQAGGPRLRRHEP